MATTETAPGEASSAPEITWAPTPDQRAGSRLRQFLNQVEAAEGIELPDYRAEHDWSTGNLSSFWAHVWRVFDVVGEGFGEHGTVLAAPKMLGASWFPGTSINWAENILRYARDPERADETAIVAIEEDNSTATLTWRELASATASLAEELQTLGVKKSDRVAAVLPNVPETIIALLATASIGAIWTVSSPELSAPGTIDRLVQLEPTVLIGIDGYTFNGTSLDCLEHLTAVREALPSVKEVIVIRHRRPSAPLPGDLIAFDSLLSRSVTPSYLRVPFGHPLWVLFSSGTTGNPKGIVHSHGGITVEAYKGNGLQQDMDARDRFYVAANTSWMVWNLLVNTLMVGASVVTYSGSGTHRRPDRQLEIVAKAGVTVFGVGAAYLGLVEKSGVVPRADLDFSRLRAMQSTGSPLPAHTWRWVHETVRKDLHLGSDSGGTDICSGFIGSNPLDPVFLGELQGAFLGVAIEAWDDDGRRVINGVGEMVITQPMPSMPIYLWGDVGGERYRETYFTRFPGVWTQGDWITETDRGSFIIHGRSDATLNRGGVRLGSSDIYSAIESMPEIAGSLVVGVELPDGGYYLPLFVVTAAGVRLDEALRARIVARIKERTSPRHVPDEILEVPAIPVSHAGKRLEIPVKRLISGTPLERAVNLSTLANPSSIDWFADFARERAS